MKNEKQLVLFLKNGSSFNQTQLAAKINEKFPLLSSPIIVPFDEKDVNRPLIIFNQGLMGLSINYNEISFVYYEDDRCNEMIFDIMDLFSDYGLDFVRMGYINTFFKTKKDRENFKKKNFVDPSLCGSDFEFAWHNLVLIDSVSVNVWERYFTDLINKVDMGCIFDINTPIDEEYNIDSDFISSFLKKCDVFIKEKLECRF